LVEINTDINCRVCPSCWFNASELYLTSLIYSYNQKIPRSAIYRIVEWQKFCLNGEFRN
jgi:hypothetical protein